MKLFEEDMAGLQRDISSLQRCVCGEQQNTQPIDYAPVRVVIEPFPVISSLSSASRLESECPVPLDLEPGHPPLFKIRSLVQTREGRKAFAANETKPTFLFLN